LLFILKTGSIASGGAIDLDPEWQRDTLMPHKPLRLCAAHARIRLLSRGPPAHVRRSDGGFEIGAARGFPGVDANDCKGRFP
jgi:hypothetical protein